MPRLEVKLDQGSYSPGEIVRGWVRVAEGGRSRGGRAADGVVLLGGGSALDRLRRAEHFGVEPPYPVRRGDRARVMP